MKKTNIILLIILVMSLMIVGCNQTSNNDSDANTEVTKTTKVTDESSEEAETNEDNNDNLVDGEKDFSDLGPVIVGMDGDTPAFTQFDENGSLEGFEVDMWNRISEICGFDVEFEHMEFSSIFASLDNGRIDVVANTITPNEERQEKYLFSIPYIKEETVFLGRADEDISDPKELDGYKVAVEPASNDENIAKEFENNIGVTLERVYYDGFSIDDVLMGRIDLWMKGESGSLDVIKEVGEDKLKIVTSTTYESPSAYPFIRDDRGEQLKEATDYAIEIMLEDGSLREINDKWVDVDLIDF